MSEQLNWNFFSWAALSLVSQDCCLIGFYPVPAYSPNFHLLFSSTTRLSVTSWNALLLPSTPKTSLWGHLLWKAFLALPPLFPVKPELMPLWPDPCTLFFSQQKSPGIARLPDSCPLLPSDLEFLKARCLVNSCSPPTLHSGSDGMLFFGGQEATAYIRFRLRTNVVTLPGTVRYYKVPRKQIFPNQWQRYD